MLWGGVGYEHSEQGAVGRTWILGRRMSLPTSLAYALVRILIFGKQGGRVHYVRTLLGCSCEPRAEFTQTG